MKEMQTELLKIEGMLIENPATLGTLVNAGVALTELMKDKPASELTADQVIAIRRSINNYVKKTIDQKNVTLFNEIMNTAFDQEFMDKNDAFRYGRLYKNKWPSQTEEEKPSDIKSKLIQLDELLSDAVSMKTLDEKKDEIFAQINQLFDYCRTNNNLIVFDYMVRNLYKNGVLDRETCLAHIAAYPSKKLLQLRNYVNNTTPTATLFQKPINTAEPAELKQARTPKNSVQGIVAALNRIPSREAVPVPTPIPVPSPVAHAPAAAPSMPAVVPTCVGSVKAAVKALNEKATAAAMASSAGLYGKRNRTPSVAPTAEGTRKSPRVSNPSIK